MARHTFRPIGSGATAICDEEYRHDTSCFDDEVVIDFPSPARAIERIRRAFVADERSAPVSADLHLSRREAREGATVPLEVPVRRTCRACGGRGETWADHCTDCGGSGVEVIHQQVKVLVPAGVPDGTRFRFAIGPRHDSTTRIELLVLVA
jgi:hypothetical protein